MLTEFDGTVPLLAIFDGHGGKLTQLALRYMYNYLIPDLILMNTYWCFYN